MKLIFMLHPLDPKIVEMCQKRKISFSINIGSEDDEPGLISGSVLYRRKSTHSVDYKLYKLKKIG